MFRNQSNQAGVTKWALLLSMAMVSIAQSASAQTVTVDVEVEATAPAQPAPVFVQEAPPPPQPQPAPVVYAPPPPPPQPAPAQPYQPYPQVQDSGLAYPGVFRLNFGGTFGFGGEGTISVDGDEVAAGDLRQTYGLQLQGQFSIGRFVFAGLNAAWRTPETEADEDRLNIFALGAVFGGRFPFNVGAIAIEPFVSLTVGLAVMGTADAFDADDAQLGVDVGFRAGTTIWFTRPIGAYFSIGYQRNDIFIDHPTQDVTFTMGQFAMDVGLSFRMGH